MNIWYAVRHTGCGLSLIHIWEHLAFFKKRLDELAQIKLTPETEKHITEEIRELSSMIISREGVLLHPFCGWEETFDIVLLTNRNFQEITREELRKLEPHAKTKAVSYTHLDVYKRQQQRCTCVTGK